MNSEEAACAAGTAVVPQVAVSARYVGDASPRQEVSRSAAVLPQATNQKLSPCRVRQSRAFLAGAKRRRLSPETRPCCSSASSVNVGAEGDVHWRQSRRPPRVRRPMRCMPPRSCRNRHAVNVPSLFCVGARAGEERSGWQIQVAAASRVGAMAHAALFSADIWQRGNSAGRQETRSMAQCAR